MIQSKGEMICFPKSVETAADPPVGPMRRARMFRLAGLALLVIVLTGCRGMGNQKYSVLSKSPASLLESSSSAVLDVRCSNVSMRADYNLWENLHMLAPRPKAWK
jgi:hypothetical protein